jgi:hypothetical protein
LSGTDSTVRILDDIHLDIQNSAPIGIQNSTSIVKQIGSRQDRQNIKITRDIWNKVGTPTPTIGAGRVKKNNGN